VVVASVFAEAEREIEGVGAGHGGDVGVEDGAGEVAGGGAGEDVGDEGSGEVLAAEAGADEEAFYLAGIAGGVAGEGPVGDAGSGNAVDEREQDFAVAARVGYGQGCGFVVEVGRVGSAGFGFAEELVVLAEEGTSLIERHGAGLDGFDAKHGDISGVHQIDCFSAKESNIAQTPRKLSAILL